MTCKDRSTSRPSRPGSAPVVSAALKDDLGYTPRNPVQVPPNPVRINAFDFEWLLSHIDPGPAEESESFVRLIYERRRADVPSGYNDKTGRDTDVASFIFKRHPDFAPRYVNLVRDFELIVSFMTLAEMRQGALDAAWGERKCHLLEGLRCGTRACGRAGPLARPTHGLRPARSFWPRHW